ncbi:MAG: YgiT-type zinc finger protein [Nitrospira sp. SB0675_bin_23]|nr:YgiT-type zinc finger protein [Nitrospira sp. SB0675_bin_23]
MADPICPETGTPMKRGVAPMTISYKDQSATFEMPGWYCDTCGESIHTGEDLKISDRMLNRLKAQQKRQRPIQPAAPARHTTSSR